MEKKIAFLLAVDAGGKIVDSTISNGLASEEEIADLQRGLDENKTNGEVIVHEVDDFQLYDGTELSVMIEAMKTLDAASNRYVFGDMLRAIFEKGFEFGIEYRAKS